MTCISTFPLQMSSSIPCSNFSALANMSSIVPLDDPPLSLPTPSTLLPPTPPRPRENAALDDSDSDSEPDCSCRRGGAILGAIRTMLLASVASVVPNCVREARRKAATRMQAVCHRNCAAHLRQVFAAPVAEPAASKLRSPTHQTDASREHVVLTSRVSPVISTARFR